MADCPAHRHLHFLQRLCVRQHHYLPRRRAQQNCFYVHAHESVCKEGRDVELDYRWVPHDQISVNLKKPLIASEDANFAEHSGFDWSGIKYAMKRNKQSGEVKAGGSTISQQLAKNLFLNESRSYIRKGEEAAITAWMMEAVTDKDRIFELYLKLNRMALRRIRRGSCIQYFYKKPASRPHPPTSRQTHGTRSRLRCFTQTILRANGCTTKPISSCADGFGRITRKRYGF